MLILESRPSFNCRWRSNYARAERKYDRGKCRKRLAINHSGTFSYSCVPWDLRKNACSSYMFNLTAARFFFFVFARYTPPLSEEKLPHRRLGYILERISNFLDNHGKLKRNFFDDVWHAKTAEKILMCFNEWHRKKGKEEVSKVNRRGSTLCETWLSVKSLSLSEKIKLKHRAFSSLNFMSSLWLIIYKTASLVFRTRVHVGTQLCCFWVVSQVVGSDQWYTEPPMT